jgi:hypothetical protein
MKKVAAALVIMLILATAIAVIGYSSITRSQHSSADVKSRFVGAWTLLRTEEVLKDGSSRAYTDIGPNGKGYLLYTEDGHMCATLVNPNRPKLDTPATIAQKIAAIDGLAAYCGRYEIDEAQHIMWHYPEIAADPGYVGTKQPRPFRFEGDHLIFSGPQPSGENQKVDRWTIVWQRAK